MKKEQAEALRIKILEKKETLSGLDFPLRYSKAQLHSGIQGRVQRQEDRGYMRRVRAQGKIANKNLKTVDDYLRNLNAYSNTPEPIEGEISIMDEAIAPIAPKITLSKIPKRGRNIRRGIGGY